MIFLFTIKRMMAHESKRADQERITTGDFAISSPFAKRHV